MLIVTGEYRSRVVRVDTEDDGYPYVTDDPDFLAWYERWLDQLLWGWDTSGAGEGLPGTEAQMVVRLLDGSCSDRDRREALRTLRRVNKPTQETKRVALAQLEAGGPGVVAEALRIVDIEVARSVTLACADAKDRGILPYLPQLKARAGGLFDVLEHNVRRDFSWLPMLIAGPLLGWLLILILKWLVAKWKA